MNCFITTAVSGYLKDCKKTEVTPVARDKVSPGGGFIFIQVEDWVKDHKLKRKIDYPATG